MVSLKQIPKISPSSYRRREAARCLLTDFPWIEKYSKITIEVAGYYTHAYIHIQQSQYIFHINASLQPYEITIKQKNPPPVL